MFTNHYQTLCNRYGYEGAERATNWFYRLPAKVRSKIKDAADYCISHESEWK